MVPAPQAGDCTGTVPHGSCCFAAVRPVSGAWQEVAVNKLTCALMRACDGVFACCCIAHTHTHTHTHAHTCAHSPSLCSPCASECQAGAPQDPGHLTENPLHLTNWASASLWPGNRERGCALCTCSATLPCSACQAPLPVSAPLRSLFVPAVQMMLLPP